MRQACLHPIRVAATLVLNFVHGPWGDAAHLGKLRHVMQEHYRNHDFQSEIFQQFYPVLTASRHDGEPPWNVGSVDQMETWAGIHAKNVFGGTSDHVKGQRWHNFSAQCWRPREDWASLLFAAFVAAFSEGLYVNWSDTPFGCGGGLHFSGVPLRPMSGIVSASVLSSRHGFPQSDWFPQSAFRFTWTCWASYP